jgi:hypothetical protein
MHVGRTVTGLPVNNPNFSILPPHFPSACSMVDEALRICFPGYPASLKFILEHALASIIYHYDFLKTYLEPNHIVFQCVLFTNKTILVNLKESIVCGLPDESSLQASGVPPSIMVLLDLEKVKKTQVKSFFY